MKLNKRLIRELYENGNKAKESDLKFYYLWNSFVKLIEENKGENESLRQGMRNYLEAVSEDLEIDYEDSVLDVLYENPVFEDLRIEEGRDVYYYEYTNINEIIPYKINSFDYPVPLNYEEALKDRYGENWRLKDSKWSYQNDPSIKKLEDLGYYYNHKRKNYSNN